MLSKIFSRSIKTAFFPCNFFGAIKKFNLPDLGEKIKEAKIEEWFVKEGDTVEEFQSIAEVSTDKLRTTIPSSFAGKIHKIFHKKEDTCLVGDLFLEIEVDDGSSATTQSEPEKTQSNKEVPTKSSTPSQSSSTTEIYNNDYILAAPSVRHLAKLNNISLKQVKGTGKDGRILKEDILKFTDPSQKREPAKKQSQEPAAAYTITVSKPTVSDVSAAKKDSKVTMKMNDFEKGMQKSMTEANSIPRFNLMEEIDMTRMAQFREEIALTKLAKHKLTYMPFLIKAFSLALTEYPKVNSLYDASKPFEYTVVNNHNITIAVDSPKGLVVPNIKGCQDLSITDIQEELNRIRKEAEAGRLGPKDLFDGTITLSNIGNIGGTYTGPVILPPQVCIVGIGKIQDLPRYIEDELKKRKIMTVSFACDHRVLDGATVARFCARWKQLLENPAALLLNLK